MQVIGRHVISWTPQQDLEGEDDSISEEDLNNNTNNKSTIGAKFTLRAGNVFSLSLPRENQLAMYMEEKARLASSTRTSTTQNQSKQPTASHVVTEQNDNWFLSRSAPNSLNNGPTSLEHEQGRFMYLPPWREQRSRPVNSKQYQSQHQQLQLKHAKSCENLATAPSRPQNLQDPPASADQASTNGTSGKPRRFTFQSTVRQIERRRLAERLSREAERKERQRLGELAAMQRVEEEFQRKRAREKASIRQQLRLYWMEGDDEERVREPGPGADELSPSTVRPEPDGCAEAGGSGSDSASLEPMQPPPRATQVLSEYRQPRREYKEWQGHPRPPSPPSAGSPTATVHPKIVCDMPRASTHQRHNHANNYRRTFAHGVRPHAKCIS